MNDVSLYSSTRFLERIVTKIENVQLSFYSLTIMIKGTASYTVNGVKYTISKGDALLVSAGNILSREAGVSKCNYLCFDFTSENNIPLPVKMEGCVDGSLSILIDAYDTILKTTSKYSEKKAECLLKLILMQLEEITRHKSYTALTRKIISYLEIHFAKRITLDEVSRIAFFSPGYCESVFKRDTGKSINDYLIDHRIELAKRHLAEDLLPLDKIAEAVGIEDYNYFARLFKKRTGSTPKEYRAKLRRAGANATVISI